jgi:hypothetical protein
MGLNKGCLPRIWLRHLGGRALQVLRRRARAPSPWTNCAKPAWLQEGDEWVAPAHAVQAFSPGLARLGQSGRGLANQTTAPTAPRRWRHGSAASWSER